MSRYAFSLDRPTLVSTVAGLCAVGALLFFSGVLVGVSSQLPPELPAPARDPGALAAAKGPAAADAVPAESAPPEEDGVGGPGDDGAPYAVQVGDFPREEPALEMLERLGRRGYEGYLVTGYDDEWRLRVQVRFGAYEEADEARLAAEETEAREGWETRVVPAEELAP
ncbi:MAG TPA: SPOR domain-containing protein [Longimicrobiaceae bacterium]|nr:SPOR domain-containing protein [Longimicrobiaceae bacterium]